MVTLRQARVRDVGGGGRGGGGSGGGDPEDLGKRLGAAEAAVKAADVARVAAPCRRDPLDLLPHCNPPIDHEAASPGHIKTRCANIEIGSLHRVSKSQGVLANRMSHCMNSHVRSCERH